MKNIYEVKIYESEEDYDIGEAFSYGIYSDLEIAKDDLEIIIDFNCYYSGVVENRFNGKEEFSLFYEQEKNIEEENV